MALGRGRQQLVGDLLVDVHAALDDGVHIGQQALSVVGVVDEPGQDGLEDLEHGGARELRGPEHVEVPE